MATGTLAPAPPPGFEIDQAPPPPPGFQVDKTQERGLLAKAADVAGAPFDLARSVIQNTAAAGVGNAQAIVEDLARKVSGKSGIDAQKRAEEISKSLSYESKNPYTNQAVEGMGEIA